MTGLERLREYAEDLSMKAGFRFAQEYGIDLLEIYKQIWSEQADERARSQQDFDNRRSELCSALGIDADTGWSDAMSELDKRLMPPGTEWPKVDGKPVEIGERLTGYGSGPDGYEVVGVRPTCNWVLVKARGGEILEWDASNCKRPKQGPIGADGLPIKRGDTVYDKNSGDRLIVGAIEDCGYTITCRYADLEDSAIPTHGSWSPCDLTHSAPVIATDGKPLSGGETVWGVNGATYRVTDVHDGKVFARHIGGSFGAEVESAGGSGLYRLRAEQLTHERPDSWEQLEKDSKENPFDYCKKVGHHLFTFDNAEEFKSSDLVRRAKALAERERAE